MNTTWKSYPSDVSDAEWEFLLRTRQARHKRMLGLKRLYWNSHPFRSGPRKKASLY